jgi:alanine-glyoxylate transaminase/serine-glyoxylate transaminase/serine-pyruvate transaminase
MARPTVGHLDPSFVALMDEVKDLLRQLMRTQHPLTFPISGPGTAGMEACLLNLVEPGDEVVVCRNGVFGGRMHAIVERAGGVPIAVDDAWGEPVDPAKVAAALRQHPRAKVLAFVHAETSTGALSDAEALAALAREAEDCLCVVDAVTSFGGVPLEVDAWGLDAVYSGSQKCLSCAPGLSPVSFSDRALDRVRKRASPVRSWFLDLGLVMGYWEGTEGKRAYHHTAPVNAIYGLHEALRMLAEEGLEAAWSRHATLHRALAAGLEALGLPLRVAAEHRLPQLNVVSLPSGIDDAATRRRLLDDYGLEIGGGLGDLAGQVWRIGLMGAACSRNNVMCCLAALDDVLRGVSEQAGKGRGIAAALEALG